jgi:hypothetical protein
MHLDHYQYRTNDESIDYEFESIGPSKTILKIARFSKIDESLYNFGFGDLDEKTGDINDTVVSNNNDGDKVLTTVANIIANFLEIYPDAKVFIQGTNKARTRRYQMGIAKHLSEIEDFIEILGYNNGNWEPFQKGTNYQAFMGSRR